MRTVRGITAAVAGLAAACGLAPRAAAVGAPEADLAYHGAATLAGGLLDVRVTPRNHGPSAVPETSVLLRWSRPPTDGQTLPAGCARSGARVVLCRVAALAADDVGEEIRLRVRLRGAPSEVRMDLDTAWSGGAVDRNRDNDRQRVLVLDTGDEYHF
ncbi:hypothetical protein [Streptomyces sp. MAA16]|uniref:hypothetical protein n=1 Tax=Streptomyces sp. MAA16 TaxID=3035116 RepID=UPI0024761636|nr:hypothetical protein [Streptomyces sp. MAA16]MDH6698561.1 hypothetical protein [Streptomyces sp. MAA16]